MYVDNAGIHHTTRSAAIDANTRHEEHNRAMAEHHADMIASATQMNKDAHDIFWHKDYGLCTQLCKTICACLGRLCCALVGCCCGKKSEDGALSEKLLQQTATSDTRLATLLEWERMFNQVGPYRDKGNVLAFIDEHYHPEYRSSSQRHAGSSAAIAASHRSFSKTELKTIYLEAHAKGHTMGPLKVLQVTPSFVEYTYPWMSQRGAAPSLFFHAVARFDEGGRFVSVQCSYRTNEPFTRRIMEEDSQYRPPNYM